jgi:hypothetical protein
MAKLRKAGRASITFDRKALEDLAEGEAKRNLIRAAIFLQNKVRESISIPTRIHGPSAPGEPPHRDTGQLWNSIFWADNSHKRKLEVVIGTTMLHGAVHEYGERPFLRPALAANLATVRRIVTGKDKPASGTK